MQFLKSLFVIVACCLLAFTSVVEAKKSNEEEDQALKDLYTGMAGLKEAASNPALLAQLMRDLQVCCCLCCEAVLFGCLIFEHLLLL